MKQRKELTVWQAKVNGFVACVLGLIAHGETLSNALDSARAMAQGMDSAEIRAGEKAATHAMRCMRRRLYGKGAR